MAEIGKDIVKARNLLDQGKIIAIPTETVYGLAGNALDINAVAQIFAIKDRPHFDPLIVHIGHISQIDDLVKQLPEAARSLAEGFWPGPLTLVLEKKEMVPDLVTGDLTTVAVRMPDHPLSLELLRSLPYPLAAPSANPFGYISPTTAEHVQDQLGKKIPYILDGGPCQVGIESTIVAFTGDLPVVYREGGISWERLSAVCGPVELMKNPASTPLAPGMLGSHYAPHKKVFLGDIPQLLEQFSGQAVGILSLHHKFEGVPEQMQVQLSTAGDLQEAAKNLFASLRKLDGMAISYILAEPVPEKGLGRAINDRLRRAAN